VAPIYIYIYIIKNKKYSTQRTLPKPPDISEKSHATHALLIPSSSSLYNKKIGFKENVVFDVTSETTFFLKSIFLKKRKRQRKDED